MMRYYFKLIAYLAINIAISSSHAGAYEDYFRAVDVDNASGVRMLLERGFDPNTPDQNGQRGLFLALRSGSMKVAEALISSADLKVDAANPHGETAVMMAALRGLPDWVARLLDRGAALNREGWSPLHYAASGPSPQAVRLLLDRGARIDALSPLGSTPLMMAAQYGSEDAVTLLLARGADPRLRDGRGLGAADYARRGGREPLAQRLDERAR